MRCSSQGDMLAATRAGLGISALSCFVGGAYPDLVRVAPQKLLSVADIWLLPTRTWSNSPPCVRARLRYGFRAGGSVKLRG
jgi:DNA-binding transcriptional LysR family regulator